MSLVLSLLVSAAFATEYRVVRPGQTVETFAEALGNATLAAEIRALNRLAENAQPSIGSVVALPQARADHVDVDPVLLAFRGAVEIKRTNGGAGPAALGALLPAGTTVCTGADGYATIRLAVSERTGAHDDLSLFPDTCLTIDGVASRRGSRASLVSVDSGSVEVRAGEGDSGEVTVRTSAGTSSGDGGGFRVTVEDDAARTEAVGAGASVFGQGEEVVLEQGYGSRVIEGQAPSAPVKLLDPGTPMTPLDGAPLTHPDFSWAPVDRALGYRVEVSASADFSDLVQIEELDTTLWTPDRLFLPFRVAGLWWRVSSVDRTGFIGAPSSARSLRVPEGLGP